MREAGRAALRQAFATAGTALVVGSLHVPQPFLAVLAAQLVGGFRCDSFADFLKRLVAAWAGAFAGLLLLAAAPDQQWISLPAFCLAAGFGITTVARRWGPAPAILFAMGIGGMFSAGLVYPAAGLLSGMAHAASLSIAAAVSALAGAVGMKESRAAARSGGLLDPWTIGLSATGSLVLAGLTLPTEGVVMTIATMTTVLGITPGAPAFGERFVGAVAGVLVSVAFLIIVSGSGNNLAVFLVAMALVMGGAEWLASRIPPRAVLFRQGAALFAVAATMLPRPEAELSSSMERMAAVILGFLAAVAVCGIRAGFCPDRGSAARSVECHEGGSDGL